MTESIASSCFNVQFNLMVSLCKKSALKLEGKARSASHYFNECMDENTKCAKW